MFASLPYASSLAQKEIVRPQSTIVKATYIYIHYIKRIQMDLHYIVDSVPSCKHYFTSIKYQKLIIPDCVPCPFVFTFGHIDLILVLEQEYYTLYFTSSNLEQEYYTLYFTSSSGNDHFIRASINKEFDCLLGKFVRLVVLMGATNLEPHLLKRLLRLGLFELKQMLEIVFSHDAGKWYLHKLTSYITEEFNTKEFKESAQTLALIDRRGWRPEFHTFFNDWTATTVETISNLNTNPESQFYKLPVELIQLILGYIAILK